MIQAQVNGQTTLAALVAARISRTLAPSTALDIGRDDDLAQHLSAVRIETEHVTSPALPSALPSEDAGADAPELPAGRWDLVTCLDVFEHLSPQAAETLIEGICQLSDRVIVSCGAAAYLAATPAPARPAAAWSAAFAERSFFRRLDLDFEFAGPWTVVFERGEPRLRDLVYRYEQQQASRLSELTARNSMRDRSQGAGAAARSADADPVAELRREVLASRDHAIGQAAELAALQATLAEVYASNTWRLGSMLTRPLGAAKRKLGARR